MVCYTAAAAFELAVSSAVLHQNASRRPQSNDKHVTGERSVHTQVQRFTDVNYGSAWRPRLASGLTLPPATALALW